MIFKFLFPSSSLPRSPSLSLSEGGEESRIHATSSLALREEEEGGGGGGGEDGVWVELEEQRRPGILRNTPEKVDSSQVSYSALLALMS